MTNIQTASPSPVVDAPTLVEGEAHACPNLPILTRGSEVACVLPDADGSAFVLVPHATVTSLRCHTALGCGPWNGKPAALDLWAVLMAGGTAVVEERPAEVAAA